MRKGRFSQPAAEIALRYGESVSFDWRPYRHDIAGSIAHAAALASAGIVTADEQQKIDDGFVIATREPMFCRSVPLRWLDRQSSSTAS
jgi:argininosuccinate lyase